MFNHRMTLHGEIQDLIESHSDLRELDDSTFNQFALKLFAHQFNGIRQYREFCERRGRTPETVIDYTDIPPVPTDVFKHVRLCTEEDPSHVFRTSGTTRDQRGEHHFSTLETYRASIRAPFREYVNPNGLKTALILAPSARDLSDSSLSWMLTELFPDGPFFVSASDGDLTFKWDALVESLDACDEPVLLLGTAFAFLSFFDQTERSWRLPAGSRVMETGGFKGRTREITRDELYEMFAARLGVTECVAEYSMTELSSQAYTNVVRDRVAWEEAVFQTPPWARVDLLDPETLAVTDADRGLIRWFDLANVDSICSILTSDIGEHRDNGFVLRGRASDAELRGCSLTIEEIMK